MCICSYCWLFSSTSCVKSEKPVHTFTPSEGSKTPERNKFKLETTDKGKNKLLGRGSIGIFSLLLLIYKGKLAKWTVLKGKWGVDVLGELRNISTTCFLPCGICMQQAGKYHNMNSFWSSICCWHVLWCWKCHAPQLWLEKLVVSKFLRLPRLGEWWQYEYRKTQLFLNAILLQGFLQALLPCLFAVLLPAPTFPSQCCSFFLAFQDVVWDAGDLLVGELHGHGSFQNRKDTALGHRQQAFVSPQLKSHDAFCLYLCTQEETVAPSTWNSTATKIPLPYSLWDISQINFLAETIILLANSGHNRLCLTLLKFG